MDIILIAADNPPNADYKTRFRLRDKRNEAVNEIKNKLVASTARPIEVRESDIVGSDKTVRIFGHQEFREYQVRTGFSPEEALDAFTNRAWLIEAVIDADIQSDVWFTLFEHLKGGRTLAETIKDIRGLFEPWVGDPEKVKPSGVTGTPEDILQAYRIENIVRTENAWAFNQGRVAVGDAAGEYLTGYQYSSIIDERTTEICLAADGLVLRKDDPRTIRLTPPNHHQCRSMLVFVTIDDLPVKWSRDSTVDRVVRLIPKSFK